MKKLLVILFSTFALAAVAQDDVKRIAILETVDKFGNVSPGVKNLLRQSITFGINRVPGYEGYNRVDMTQITGEHNFQRSGYVSDADIKKLGQMTGASYVLIAEATKYDSTHIVVYANLVDVESGRVTHSSIPKLASLAPNEMYEDCAEVAKSLLGVSTANDRGEFAMDVLSEEYSLVTTGDPYMTPIEIDNTGTYTKAVFKYITPTADKIIVSLSSYAQDNKTGKTYQFTGASGITANQWTNVAAGIHTFTVSCEKMPDDMEDVTIYYTEDRYWKLKLVPYGKRGYYRFEDKSEELYAAAVEKLQNADDALYLLRITNNMLHSRVVYVDGQNIGVVPGLSVKTFVVPIKYYKRIELVQKDYIFKPSREFFNRSIQPIKGQVIEIVDNPL